MIEITEKSKCTGCNACASICPQQCIRMIPDKEGFWYPKIDKKKCINCNLCVKTCPVIAEKAKVQFQKAYSAYAKDEAIRMESSSGGIFSVFAEYIIDNGGVVFGAAFNDDLQVEHICVDNKTDLAKLRMSKYVQSSIGKTYIQAKESLESGRIVMFTGTPCQIAGLKMFLRKDYDNLYTQDIVCHGVPSPEIWRQYIQYKKAERKSDIETILFRSKVSGWKHFSIQYVFPDRSSQVCSQSDDLYFKAFLDNLTLRPSCYHCEFKGSHAASDITLGDFWGIENVIPDMDDNRGVSLVVCNSNKGRQLFDSVSPKMIWKEVGYRDAVKGNVAATRSVFKKASRDVLFKYYHTHNVQDTLKLFCSTNDEERNKVQLWEDYETVKKEKGALFAFLWKTKNRLV